MTFMRTNRKIKDLELIISYQGVKHVFKIRTRAHDAPLFNINVPKCETFKRSVGYFGSLSWNNSPVITRNIDSLPTFKKSQKLAMFHPLSLIPDI